MITGEEFKKLIEDHDIQLNTVGLFFGKPEKTARQFGRSLTLRKYFSAEENQQIMDLIATHSRKKVDHTEKLSAVRGTKAPYQTRRAKTLATINDGAMPVSYPKGSIIVLSINADGFIIDGYRYAIETESNLFVRIWFFDAEKGYTGYPENEEQYTEGQLKGKPKFGVITIPSEKVKHIYNIIENRRPELTSTDEDSETGNENILY